MLKVRNKPTVIAKIVKNSTLAFMALGDRLRTLKGVKSGQKCYV